MKKIIFARIFKYKYIGNLLLVFFCSLVLLLSLRGIAGNPNLAMLNQDRWKDGGPLELSPERGRYALLYSVVENHSLRFSVDLARFVMPDVAYTDDGHYASLFAPAVSFISIPGYFIGRYFGIAQVGSFAVIAVFALLNFWLIRQISILVGANSIAATLAGFIFLFATPAFSYAVTLYQHHISTFLILMSIYLLLRHRNIFSFIFVWILIAFSVTVDYPNFFMMLPVGIFTIYQAISAQKVNGQIKVDIAILKVLSFAGVIVPLLFFFWFNMASYGNPFQLSGTLRRATQIGAKGEPVNNKKILVNTKNGGGTDTSNEVALSFFVNRNITNGMYILFLSPDRGMLVFTPIILSGFAGFIWALKRRNSYVPLFFSVLGFNILIYSMWGDPWGGWAFGARYLIPGYAMLAIFIALLLTYWRRKNLFLLSFFMVLNYSIAVNTLGALTSNKNPPKVEAVAMEQAYHIAQPYSFDRNMNMLDANVSKSFAFTAYAHKYMSAWSFYIIITVLLILTSGIIIFLLRVKEI